MTDMPPEMQPTVAELGLPDLDAVITTAPEPGPITPDNVVSEPATEIPAPDSAILDEKITKLLSRDESIEQRRTQEREYDSLQEELRVLRALQGPDYQQKYSEISKRVETADDDQSQLMKNLQTELGEMKASQDALQQQLRDKAEESEYLDASKEVSTWVESNREHFPLINEIGQQALVLQKMWNTKQETGHMPDAIQATRDIEKELEGVVEKCAPLLGYTKREQKAERDEAVSATTTGLVISEPIDRDTITEEDRLEYMLRQLQG